MAQTAAEILRYPGTDADIDIGAVNPGYAELIAADYCSDNPRLIFVACREDAVEVHNIPALRIDEYSLAADPDVIGSSLANGHYMDARLRGRRSHRDSYEEPDGSVHHLVFRRVGYTAIPLGQILDIDSRSVQTTN